MQGKQGASFNNNHLIFVRERKGTLGFPGGSSGKEPPCHGRGHKRGEFDSWVRKIPWRREWYPTPVFLPRESPWSEEPGGLQSMGSQRVRHDWSDSMHEQNTEQESAVQDCLRSSGSMGCRDTALWGGLGAAWLRRDGSPDSWESSFSQPLASLKTWSTTQGCGWPQAVDVPRK